MKKLMIPACFREIVFDFLEKIPRSKTRIPQIKVKNSIKNNISFDIYEVNWANILNKTKKLFFTKVNTCIHLQK